MSQQVVLLYGAALWVVTRKDSLKLRSFHIRAVRFMTGSHIRKGAGGQWSYPEHDVLLEKCDLQAIDTYIERRRITLKRYLELYRSGLLAEVERCRRHCKNVNKVLWWKQGFNDTLI